MYILCIILCKLRKWNHTVYSSRPLSLVLLSVASVTRGQPQSKNMKWKYFWKIPEISHS